MNNNILDKVYLALELTKIRYNKTNVSSNEDVLNTYIFYIERLTEIPIEKLNTIDELEQKVMSITKEYNELKQNFNSKLESAISSNNKSAITYLNNHKGDMEPDVYRRLISLLQK